jgi:hypothetical protein
MEPTSPEIAATLQSMRDRGIHIVYGRWLIEGAPRVILIDTKTAYGRMDEWKADLWEAASIPSPPGDDETNEAIVFGYLVAWFLGEVNSLDYPTYVSDLLTLVSYSSSAMRRRGLSLLTSTSGLLALPCPSARSAASM